MPPPRLHIAISPAYSDVLRKLADERSLPLEEFAAGILTQYALTGIAPTQKRPVGRPVTVGVNDLPADVERAPSVSGFVGVTKYGRQWQAKVGRDVIGQFSSPALAACARYFAIRGFQMGRGAAFGAEGFDPVTAMSMAARAGYGAFTVPQPGVGGQKDSSANPDEGSTKEPGEATADGGTAPTTLPATVPQLDVFSQVARGVIGGSPVSPCPGCEAATSPPGLCAACKVDFAVWNQLPAAGQVAPPGSPPQLGGSPAGESFVDYVKRTRGLV